MDYPKEIRHIILDYLPIEKFLHKDLKFIFPDYIRNVPWEEDCHRLRNDCEGQRQRIRYLKKCYQSVASAVDTRPWLNMTVRICGPVILGLATKTLLSPLFSNHTSRISEILSLGCGIIATLTFAPLWRTLFDWLAIWTRQKSIHLFIREVQEIDYRRKVPRRRANFTST